MTLHISVATILCVLLYGCHRADGLGGMETVAASYDGTATVCGVLSGESQGIQCVRGLNADTIQVFPNVSFLGISGGDGFFCGLRRGGLQLLCWSIDSRTFKPKRISKRVPLKQIAVGKRHVCGVRNDTGKAVCWRGSSPPKAENLTFSSITAGADFTCGVLENNSSHCWSLNGSEMFTEITKKSSQWRSEVAGSADVCAFDFFGDLNCFGNNTFNQTTVPRDEFARVAVGVGHACGLSRLNKTVTCWGLEKSIAGTPSNQSFEVIVAGDSFTCGIVSSNYSVFCWGGRGFESGAFVNLSKILPGICSAELCPCGVYPDSDSLCSLDFHVCSPCGFLNPQQQQKENDKKVRVYKWQILVFAIVGSVGALIGIVSILWCLWRRFGKAGKVHNSVQPQLGHASSVRRQGTIRRQRSGTSSSKRGAEEFTMSELSVATDGFAEQNMIGAGSFGTVYKGKLRDGREVAIKRGGSDTTKKFQEKEAAFQSELGFLSRLHHRNLVSLVGYCEEAEERMLVYEFMRNGSLYEHLHNKSRELSLVSSWTSRIKIALDAARGIEYLHTYAVPPIIHRDIKSSNILIDATGSARVSDFGLSLMGPDVHNGFLSMKAAGTVGYMDPEYYRLQHLTTKSDVYGFGVVLLELLTGRKAIFKPSENSGPVSVVDFVVPRIMADELHLVLDTRIMPPGPREIEAVELVAYISVMCVSLEGKDRPSMTDVVANLERAVSICARSSAERVSRSGSLARSSSLIRSSSNSDGSH